MASWAGTPVSVGEAPDVAPKPSSAAEVAVEVSVAEAATDAVPSAVPIIIRGEEEAARAAAADAVGIVASSAAGGGKTPMSDDSKETAAAEAACAVAPSVASTFTPGKGGWPASRRRMRPSLWRRQPCRNTTRRSTAAQTPAEGVLEQGRHNTQCVAH